MTMNMIFFRRANFGLTAALLCLLLMPTVMPAHAAITTTTTVTSSANPSATGQSVTFSAKISGAQYAAPFTAGRGASLGASLFYRYELANATFGATVVPSDFTNNTAAGSIAAVTITQGGSPGDTFVVLQITVGTPSLSTSDILQLNFVPGQFASNSSISFSVHDTPLSAVGAVPNNSTLIYGPITSQLSSLSPPVPLTGTISFFNSGVLIPSCGTLAITAGSASCGASFVTPGNYTITANYTGDVNYTPSSGALLGGQSVGLAVTPSAVSGAAVGRAFTQAFSSNGTAPFTFSVTSGSLPSGLSLTSSGVLSGTPTTAGTSTFLISVTDSVGASGGANISMTVAKGNQTITFNAPANAVVGTTFTLNGTASSGLEVDYSIASPTVCTRSGNTLSFIAIGVCSITPLQSGNANYFAAPSSARSINVLLTGGVKPMRLRSATGQSLSAELSGTNTLFFTATSDPGSNFRAVAIADLDGNKSPDLIYQNTAAGDPGEVRVWKDFDSSQDRALRNVRLAWRVDAVGDLDGDGFGDLVWRFTGSTANVADTGVSYVWFTNGSGVTQVRKRGGAPLNWTLVGAMDLNGDGAADMLYVSPTNEIRALMATPGRTCANLSAGFMPAGFTALKVGSFIATGRPEMLIRNSTTGEVRLMIFDGTGLQLPAFTGDPNDPNAACTSSPLTVLSAAIPFALTEPAWTFFGTADFNGDGFLDIVWRREDGIAYIWLTSGSNQLLTGIPNAGLLPNGYTAIQP